MSPITGLDFLVNVKGYDRGPGVIEAKRASWCCFLLMLVADTERTKNKKKSQITVYEHGLK